MCLLKSGPGLAPEALLGAVEDTIIRGGSVLLGGGPRAGKSAVLRRAVGRIAALGAPAAVLDFRETDFAALLRAAKEASARGCRCIAVDHLPLTMVLEDLETDMPLIAAADVSDALLLHMPGRLRRRLAERFDLFVRAVRIGTGPPLWLVAL